MTTSRGLIGFFALCLVSATSAQENQDFDVVTMNNGDIFNGNLVLEQFDIDTGYGTVAVSADYVTDVEIDADRLGVRIHTRFGDRFHGRAKHPALRIIRPLEPTLPLAIADISTIRIAPRPLRIKGLNAADTLETVSGDLFAARLISRELLLKTRSGLQLINLDNVHIVEIELSQEEPLAQVTFNGGDIQQGQLLTETVRVHSRYGDTLDIPVEKITRMGIRVNYRDNDSPRFNYRKQVPQAAWFQDRLRDGNMGPEMVALRGGAYTRGDSRGDDDESPPHTINLSPFAIAIYEITFEDYDRFAASTHREHPNDEDWGRGRRPVINVSWDDARAYVDWLSQQTGETYRLPTDAEWEYAARARSQSRFWWGSETGIARANCAGCQSLWDGEKSSPVGRFLPNSFGLHDTAGNVFEWVEDCWDNRFSEAPRNGGALVKPGCGVRVIRGGAWSFPPTESRSANRWRNFQSRRSDDTGFRVVRELPK